MFGLDLIRFLEKKRRDALKLAAAAGVVFIAAASATAMFPADKIIYVIAIITCLTLTAILAVSIYIMLRQSRVVSPQSALRNSEHKYHLLFDRMINGFALHDIIFDSDGKPVDFKFLELNQSFAAMTGLNPKDVIGRTCLEILPDLDQFWYDIYGQVALSGKPARFEHFSNSLNRYYEVSAYCPQRGQFATVFHDITERKLAEQALRDSKSRLDLALTSAHMGVWSYDCKTGLRKYDNQVCALFGIDPTTFTGKQEEFFKVLHPDDVEKLKAAVVNTIQTADLFELEYRVIWPDSSVHHIASRGRLLSDENGNPLKLNGILWDITEQKRAEESLKRDEQLLSTIFASVPVGICFLKDRVFHNTNHYWCENFGYTKEETIGRTARFLYDEDAEFERVGRELYTGLQKVGIKKAITRLRTKSGLLRDVELTAALINKGKTDEGVIVVVDDITERKFIQDKLLEVNRYLEQATLRANHMAAKAELADMAKTQFLANMSHEIRTPMNAIIGFGELLQGLDLTDEQKKYVSIINDSGNNLLRLVNDILDFSKIESGKLCIEDDELELQSQLASIEAMMQTKAAAKNIKLEIVKSDNLPEHIITDQVRLRQCLVNLLDNAIKFTHKGYVRLIVNCENKNNHPYIRFDVEDTGIGIAADKQETIFDPFVQADGSTTRKYGGTGLGLSITRQLAMLLKGELAVFSREGKGSVFSLLLPVNINAANALVANEESRVRQFDQNSDEIVFSGNVLIAEDVKTNQILAEKMLQKLGLNVTIVEDGIEAVSNALTGEFDLILMDMMMPNMNGYDATKEIRNKGIMTPIVAMTAKTMADDKNECIKAGCDDYIAKPFSQNKLIQILRKYLIKYSPRHSNHINA